MAVSKEYRAYAFAQRPFSERDLAGIIKHHPEERKPIMDVLTFYSSYYSCKLIQTYLDWDDDITDDKYPVFKERLAQGFADAQKKDEQENEETEKCRNCGARRFSFECFCLECGKYIFEDVFAPEKEMLYARIEEAYCFPDGDGDKTIKACDAFLASVSTNARPEKTKLALVKPGGDTATAADERIARVYEYRGKACQKSGRYDDAIADFTSALTLKPTKTEYLEGRAKAFQAKGMYDDAIADLTGALELSERYVQSGRYEADLEREENSDPVLFPPLPPHYSVLLALVYREMGELSEALAELNASLEDWGDVDGLLVACAEIYEITGEFQKAYGCWKKIHDGWQEGLKERQDTIAENENIGRFFKSSYDTHEKYITVNLERCRKKANADGGNILRFDKNRL